MLSIDQQLENARNAQLNNHLESIFDTEDFLYRCEECGDTKPLIEMKFTREHVDAGCCNDCAKDQDIADLWGFDNGND